ncbi:uncharacterized protein LOC62_06G008406 [Vanrija pseudolonga]|uniref:Uncharacterized protein n=1 Tax=Vanrija pseudolonga TaxID=143232 RepID=A0AAF0YDT6_9TREE|nr:hypothetical protein LOC62_06G008406 [Vanrija pseudolonga]
MPGSSDEEVKPKVGSKRKKASEAGGARKVPKASSVKSEPDPDPPEDDPLPFVTRLKQSRLFKGWVGAEPTGQGEDQSFPGHRDSPGLLSIIDIYTTQEDAGEQAASEEESAASEEQSPCATLIHVLNQMNPAQKVELEIKTLAEMKQATVCSAVTADGQERGIAILVLDANSEVTDQDAGFMTGWAVVESTLQYLGIEDPAQAGDDSIASATHSLASLFGNREAYLNLEPPGPASTSDWESRDAWEAHMAYIWINTIYKLRKHANFWWAIGDGILLTPSVLAQPPSDTMRDDMKRETSLVAIDLGDDDLRAAWNGVTNPRYDLSISEDDLTGARNHMTIFFVNPGPCQVSIGRFSDSADLESSKKRLFDWLGKWPEFRNKKWKIHINTLYSLVGKAWASGIGWAIDALEREATARKSPSSLAKVNEPTVIGDWSLPASGWEYIDIAYRPKANEAVTISAVVQLAMFEWELLTIFNYLSFSHPRRVKIVQPLLDPWAWESVAPHVSYPADVEAKAWIEENLRHGRRHAPSTSLVDIIRSALHQCKDRYRHSSIPRDILRELTKSFVSAVDKVRIVAAPFDGSGEEEEDHQATIVTTDKRHKGSNLFKSFVFRLPKDIDEDIELASLFSDTVARGIGGGRGVVFGLERLAKHDCLFNTRMVEVADEDPELDGEEESVNGSEDGEETVSPWIQLEAKVSTAIEPVGDMNEDCDCSGRCRNMGTIARNGRLRGTVDYGI